ncbi:MAG TPA: tripartite tricarboxylate transporter substrate binding protein [Burkholderiales bacterium]|nr:tripartite tricarboxylate transporter substrate binding protein [Burkholderiales bacterium]
MDRGSGVVLGLFAALTANGAAAQSGYPEKPIRIVSPYLVGTPSDIAARLLGQKYTDAWGRPVVIENIVGASGNIGAERVAKATPDGYTLVLAGNAPMVINPSLYDKLPFDPVKDFAPVSQVCLSASILAVSNSSPAKSVQELVALARAQPGKLTFGSAGSGTPQHMAGELLNTMAGIRIVHVPYKGSPAGVLDLLGGRLSTMFGITSVILPLARADKLRALAVTSLERSASAPELPTMAESGYPGFEATSWFALLAPAGTPVAVVRKLHLETVKALAQPDLRAKFGELGMEPVGSSPQQLAAIIKADIPKWAKVIRDSGAKLD